ncbi:MAG TPA: UDP-N-acetylglucosamine 2-epimerase (non-hydrolyzing) [Vicinamibacterales bacterium]|nr:UDP-N-acetylglucosamine 2-epimerase (non-hydrolyzing) [Vicinamibacterales bacterium]
MTQPLRVMSIVGARPNFMKIAPIVSQMKAAPDAFRSILVHTGQHYDEKLSKVFFDELGIPHPDFNLNVGSGSHAQQTAAIMAAFEPVLLANPPDVLIVVGDVNSTLACALVASKLGVPVAHVEAGLRSFDRTMPEEINRLLTDQISDFLFTSELGAAGNLHREGVDAAKIHFVGNVMIDTLLAHRESARQQDVPARFDVTPRGYGLLTLHRPSNVDDLATFERVIEAVATLSREMPIVFPVHPRTRPMLARSARAAALVADGRLRPVDPLGYVDFLGLMESSRIVLTDSGGIQEETTILGVPCLTLRENTERPATITHGTNQLVGTDPARMVAAWRRAEAGATEQRVPPLWDGQAASRIVDVLRKFRVPTLAAV